MKRSNPAILLLLAMSPAIPIHSQADPNSPDATLRISSRAVLVDVVVTDHKGKPVTGLPRSAFTVSEQGLPQTVSFFEEYNNKPAPPAPLPKMPPDVFSNFSPFPDPPAVNVLLLDSLNTKIENQSFVHQQALKFLKSARPGSRMAIFTMALGLHFVQGFTDDPALLVAALNKKSNNEVQDSVMLKGQEETNAQQSLLGAMSGPQGADPAMIAALSAFIQENDVSNSTDRVLVTLANLQRLATFLNGFPGRKNVIWFSESPLLAEQVDTHIDEEYKKTMNMLAAARVAIYPVDARGVVTDTFYQAANTLSPGLTQGGQLIGNSGAQTSQIMAESEQRIADQEDMKRIAHDSGGQAFVNSNALDQIMNQIASSSSDFYTLSYTPNSDKMDGAFHKIDIKVEGNYVLNYRRGYYALDPDLPGSALTTRAQAVAKLAADNPNAVDPLLPFMDLGMPQSEQILYEALVHPLPPKAAAAAASSPAPTGPAATGSSTAKNAYSVDFAVDRKDVRLKLNPDGTHGGALNVSLIAYDRYGRIAGRTDQIVALNLKPDVYALFGKTGVQIHQEIAVPAKGQFWLRTGVYDQATHKVGTMELPLSAVTALETAKK